MDLSNSDLAGQSHPTNNLNGGAHDDYEEASVSRDADDKCVLSNVDVHLQSCLIESKSFQKWNTVSCKMIRRSRLLQGLETEALSRLASADRSERAQIESGVSLDQLLDTVKMELAIETYRHLPLIVRAKLENWTIQRSEILLGERLSKAPKSQQGFSGVYLASYRRLDVVVKIWEGDLLVQSKELQSIHSEITVLAQIRHPNVVVFIGACIESQACAIVTEFMPGGSLQALLDRKNEEGDGRPWRLGLHAWTIGSLRPCCFAVAMASS